MIPGTPKDSYTNRAKPHIKTLIEDQLKEMQSSKVIMGKMEEACKVSYYLRRADTVYVCAYQDASINP